MCRTSERCHALGEGGGALRISEKVYQAILECKSCLRREPITCTYSTKASVPEILLKPATTRKKTGTLTISKNITVGLPFTARQKVPACGVVPTSQYPRIQLQLNFHEGEHIFCAPSIPTLNERASHVAKWPPTTIAPSEKERQEWCNNTTISPTMGLESHSMRSRGRVM